MCYFPSVLVVGGVLVFSACMIIKDTGGLF